MATPTTGVAMEMREKKLNDSREWALPHQGRRRRNAARQLSDAPCNQHDNSGRRVPDALGSRPDAAAGSRRIPGRRGAEPGRPELAAIVAAVEEMREDRPRIGVGGLCQQFRCRGGQWTLVTREDVRAALALIECAARREFTAPHSAERSRRRAARTPHVSWPQFRQAVTEWRDRGADVPGIVARLRESGWQVGHDDVTGALRRIKAANAPRHFLPGQSLPAPRQPGPGICLSCEAPITDLGLCRCS
jgi:hypothetical protein